MATLFQWRSFSFKEVFTISKPFLQELVEPEIVEKLINGLFVKVCVC